MNASANNANTLFLLDASGFIFRAFHALPMLNRKDGTPVNAVYGFVNMLIRLRNEFHAADIAVIFDAARKNFRNDIYPNYKANRSETPSELVPQFALVREATAAYCLPAIELEGYEADDLIAAYAKAALAEGREVVIVSSDKDLLQLIRPGVRMLDPIRYELMGADAAIKKFGVPPEKVVDVQALAGDSTDNVPGVPGIGVKTAAELILQFGDLETLLARAGEIKQNKRRESLIEFAEQARISKRLVVLADDAPMPLPLSEIKPPPFDETRWFAFLMEQGFNSLLNKLRDKANNPTVTSSASSLLRAKETSETAAQMNLRLPDAFKGEGNYRAIQNLDELKGFLAAAREKGILCFDCETTSLTPCTTKLVGLAFAHTVGEGVYVPIAHIADETQISHDDVIAAVKEILEDPAVLKIAHNAKFDWQVLNQDGVRPAPIDDTILLSYVLDGTRHSHGMDALALLHLGVQTQTFESVCGKGKNQITFDRVPIDAATRYAAEDADITLRLWQILKPRLPHEQAAVLYETVERPLISVIGRMESNGVLINTEYLANLSRKMGAQLEVLANDIFLQAGRMFNIGSPKQLGEVLFGELGIPGGKKSKTGEFSTAVDVLEPLSAQYPIVAKVLEWRGLAKLQNTYADSLPEQIDPKTGRIHTSFAMTVTSTGRLSSTDPNLQNIPIRTADGKAIRAAFVAPPGYKLVSVDYSQIELRLAAVMADIPALKAAFKNGDDIHAITASEVLSVPLAQITPDQRRSAKAINFGIIYGISGWGLAKQLGIAPGDANEIIKRYFMRFPELRDYMESAKEQARKLGYVLTLLGRKCICEGINDKNPSRRAAVERQAINAPLQGTAADIMKRAMIAVDRWIENERVPARLLLQVHDELVLEARDDVADTLAARVAEIMEQVGKDMKLSVPLTAESDVAERWS